MNYLEGCYLETISYAIVWLKDKLLGPNKLKITQEIGFLCTTLIVVSYSLSGFLSL